MLTKKLMGAGGLVGGGAAAEAYWIALLGGAGYDIFFGVAVDSSDNIICVGWTGSDGAGSSDGLIAKYNSSGTLQWDRTLGGTGADVFYGVTVDSSDNIICAGYTTSDGAGSNDCFIAKYNSSGTLQWDRTLGGTGFDRFEAVTVDSSDNYICVGYTNSDGAGNYDALIAKYNSSGTLQWDRTLGGTGSDYFDSVTVDSSDNIICAGMCISGSAGSFDGFIAKYNSSGTLQWDRRLGGGSLDYFYGVAVDSSDNIICAGKTQSDGAGNNDALIAKYNSSGTLQWDRTLGGTGTEYFNAIAVDSSDNYICAGGTQSDCFIAKYNSSGTLQWDRTLGTSGQDYFESVTVDSSDNIICAGLNTANYDAITFRIISDGTLTGTHGSYYGGFVYAAAGMTDAGAVLTDAKAFLTDAEAVLTDAEAVLTDAEAVLTAELIEVS